VTRARGPAAARPAITLGASGAAQKILEHVVLGQPGPRAAPEAPKVIAGRAAAGPRARVTARR
jgi:hypothetical protein